ncbi:MAG: CRISPR-associated helicase Cas3' [Ligilactobacillus saerimneri]|nr:CRISPR-associated helicase Cas3' [Ligilactobacillus saerimneri]
MVSQRTKTLWAKKRNDNGRELWLPLLVHLIDTQNVINYLYLHWLNDGQRTFLRQGFDTDDDAVVQRLIKFIGFIHDIGKATPAFQTKKSYRFNPAPELDQELIERLIQSGFTDLDQVYLAEPNKSPHTVAGEALLAYWGVPETISAIIGGHHGKPLRKNEHPQGQLNNYEKNYWQVDSSSGEISLKWQSVQEELFEEALRSSGYSDISEIPQMIPKPQAVVIEGLLIMADWLASTEYSDDQVELFNLFPLTTTYDGIDTQTRFQNAMITWERTSRWSPHRIIDGKELYAKRWGFTNVRPVQGKMTDAIGNLQDPGIIIVEAPMGIGKTEIALAAAEQLAGQKGLSGVFIGLPTQATTNAMFSRVKEWTDSIAQDENITLDIQLQHGKRALNKEYRRLPRAQTIMDDETEKDYLSSTGQVVVDSWFNGKKSILTNFVVATIDHLLLMGLKQKHLFLRHLSFSGKVVIIDEVHAYSAYMNSYLQKTLEWLGVYGVPVVVLSATLPKDKRNELIKAYLKGHSGKRKPKLAPENWQENEAYPLLSMTDGDQLIQITDFPPMTEQKLQVVREDIDNESLISEITCLLEKGGIAGLIVNTVQRAQELAQLATKIAPHLPTIIVHSRFVAADRALIEDKLQSLIGKHGKRPDKLLVIGTQVLEQSLDIDFDVMFTDIAPMDLLLQRVGRLHRHTLQRPQTFTTPKLYVLGISKYGNYGDGNEAIYGKYLLKKTDYFLPAEITLPTDISHLVQVVYDTSTNEEVPEITTDYAFFAEKVKKKKSNASAFQIGKIGKNEKKASLHGWLDYDAGNLSDERANAAVRDIEETLEVIVTRASRTGDELVDGQKLENLSSEIIAEQTVQLPRVFSLDNKKIEKTIAKLEEQTAMHYPHWQQDSWLRGMLALRLDSNNQALLDDYQLTYLPDLGLSYKKVEQ